jgi:hypothetical protein
LLGTFNTTGNVTVDNPGMNGCPAGVACITWTDPPATGANKADISASGLSGVFATLVGFSGNDAANISDLHNPPQIVDSIGFPPTLFMSFNNAGVTTTLLINFIAAGVFSNAACGDSPAAGQNCTLTGSLFNFTNISANQSTASWVFQGITNDGQSKWVGSFTSQFNVPYQQVFANLGSAGFVTNSYSATFTLTAIPEPDPLLLTSCGLGLLAFSTVLRKKLGRR